MHSIPLSLERLDHFYSPFLFQTKGVMHYSRSLSKQNEMNIRLIYFREKKNIISMFYFTFVRRRCCCCGLVSMGAKQRRLGDGVMH